MKNLFMRKGILLTIAILVALAAVPLTYAWYTGGWASPYCTPTTECKLCFWSVSASDNEPTFPEPKEVGQTTASIQDCKTLVVTVANAYPGYNGIVDFCVKNTGSLPATITSIVTTNPNPGYLQLNLTGAVQPGVTLQQGNIKCGHLVISGIPQLPDAQNRTFTFTITINFQCAPGNCNTAYAYLCCPCGNSCSPYAARCFTYYGFSNWGWSNGKLGAKTTGAYTFDIYAGAAGCDRSKGRKVGTLTLVYRNSTATVTYNMFAGNYMTSTHLYIGSTPLYKVNGNYTTSPGQFPNKHENLNYVTTDSYTVTGLSGCIYIVAHADVCR